MVKIGISRKACSAIKEMKIWQEIYAKISTLENIFECWEEFRKNKKKRKDIIAFERNLEDNLFLLQQDLVSKKYKHGGYEAFLVRDPKLRLIHKASVRDRVVHHIVSRELETKNQRRRFLRASWQNN